MIAEHVAAAVAYPEAPALRTTAYLPPRETIGAEALEERLARARRLAVERGTPNAEPVHTATEDGRRPSVEVVGRGVVCLPSASTSLLPRWRRGSAGWCVPGRRQAGATTGRTACALAIRDSPSASRVSKV